MDNGDTLPSRAPLSWFPGTRRTCEGGAICRTCSELLEAARAGTATGLVGESVARGQSWSQLAFVEVRDIAPSTLAIAWRSDNPEPAVRNFVDLAIDLSTPSPSGPAAQPAAK